MWLRRNILVDHDGTFVIGYGAIFVAVHRPTFAVVHGSTVVVAYESNAERCGHQKLHNYENVLVSHKHCVRWVLIGF